MSAISFSVSNFSSGVAINVIKSSRAAFSSFKLFIISSRNVLLFFVSVSVFNLISFVFSLNLFISSRVSSISVIATAVAGTACIAASSLGNVSSLANVFSGFDVGIISGEPQYIPKFKHSSTLLKSSS